MSNWSSHYWCLISIGFRAKKRICQLCMDQDIKHSTTNITWPNHFLRIRSYRLFFKACSICLSRREKSLRHPRMGWKGKSTSKHLLTAILRSWMAWIEPLMFITLEEHQWQKQLDRWESALPCNVKCALQYVVLFLRAQGGSFQPVTGKWVLSWLGFKMVAETCLQW